MDEYEDVRHAVRAAIRSIGPGGQQPSAEEMAAAIRQLAFAVDKLATLMGKSKPMDEM